MLHPREASLICAHNMHARFQDAYAFFMEGWIEAAKEEQEFRYSSLVESSFVGLVSGDRGGNGEVLKKSSFSFFFFFGFDELERVEDGTSDALNEDLRVGLLGFKISGKRWFYLRRYSIEIGT